MENVFFKTAFNKHIEAAYGGENQEPSPNAEHSPKKVWYRININGVNGEWLPTKIGSLAAFQRIAGKAKSATHLAELANE